MEENLDLNNIFKKKVINELFSKYDYIKTLMQSNYQDSDEDSFDEEKVNNIYDKKCLKIIERIKFLFDFLKKNYDKSVHNLAVRIDNFFMKRKIDIRADLKDVKENIKENENLNIQRNKDIKETLEELKFKIKGYSAKKERKLKEIENLEGKKLEFKDELSKDIDKKEIINLDENVEENNIEPEVKEKEKEDKK